MTEVLPGSVYAGDDDADREAVEQERAKLREFVEGLSAGDIKSGGWFTKLCAQALRSYAEKATWEYFQQKYKGVPADGIVGQQIKLAAKNAMIEGGITSSLYNGTIAATIGSLGGASPATGDISAALAEMDSLSGYEPTPEQAADFCRQKAIIEALTARQRPPTR